MQNFQRKSNEMSEMGPIFALTDIRFSSQASTGALLLSAVARDELEDETSS